MAEEKRPPLSERASKSPTAAPPAPAPAPGTKLRSSLGESMDAAQREKDRLLDQQREEAQEKIREGIRLRREAVVAAVQQQVGAVRIRLGQVEIRIPSGLEHALRAEVVEYVMQIVGSLLRQQGHQELVAEYQAGGNLDPRIWESDERQARAAGYRVQTLLASLRSGGYVRDLDEAAG